MLHNNMYVYIDIMYVYDFFCVFFSVIHKVYREKKEAQDDGEEKKKMNGKSQEEKDYYKDTRERLAFAILIFLL